MIKTGNLRVVFGDGEDSLIGDGKGEAIEMRIHKVPRTVELWYLMCEWVGFLC